MLQIQIQNQIFEADGFVSLSPVNPTPAAPTNFDVSDDSFSVFDGTRLVWTNNAVNATGIEVWRTIDAAAPVLLATIGPTETHYDDPNVGLFFPGTYMEYKIRAVNATNQSAFTDGRAIASELGALNKVIYDYPRLVIHLSTLSLTNGNETTVTMPLLRQIYFGGLSIAAPLSTFNLNSLRTTATSITIGFTNLTSISFPSLTDDQGDAIFDNNASLTSLSAPVLSTLAGKLTGVACGALATVSFPSLTSATDIDFGSDSAITQVDFTSLVSVSNTLFLADLPLLASPTLPNLQSVGSDFHIENATTLSPLNLPKLQSIGGSFFAFNCAASESDFSLLATVGGGLDLSGNFNIEGWDIAFPALTSVGGDLLLSGSAIKTFSAPVLNLVANNFELHTSAALTSLSAPALTSVGTHLDYSANAALTSVSFSALQSIGDFLAGDSCTSLVTVAFPSLTTIAGSMGLSDCPALQNISIPVLIITDGTVISFHNDALAVGVAASGTGVDGILRRGVVSGVSTCSFDLSGGTNSPPTGGVTNPDYIALTGAGNTVSINP